MSCSFITGIKELGTLFQFPYRTVAEISVRDLVKNLVTLRAMCKKEVIPVVKADAYGHGMIPIAKALVSRGCAQTLAVATLEEAIELRKKFPHAVKILVLSGFLPHQLEAYLKYHLVPVIHSLHHLKGLLGNPRLPEIHLKLDTGMNRLGITPPETDEAMRVLGKLGIKLSGLMSHLAESEVTTSTFSDEQITLFERLHAKFGEARLLHTDAKIHVANSGGVFRNKTSVSTAVRPGLSLYGVSPNPRWDVSQQLTPILNWRARILCIKNLTRGSTVGYGRTYRAKRAEKIAIVPIGYADGYPRLLSNLGQVLINGRRAAVRGIISMDMTAVDCTNIPGVKEGMAVTLIGTDGKETLTAWDLAHWAKTIPYEIFCGISPRVPKVYFD